MARSLVSLLAARVAAARAADDATAGVYAVPGPRGQGDEAASEPVLAAELLDDEVRVSDVQLTQVRIGRDEPDDDGGGLN